MNTPDPVQDQASPFPMVQGMRVSVIVPTFNRANYIAECLDSLLAQTMPALEIIVIDDGSEDGTAGVLQAYGRRIRYIRKENGGKPTAVNLGLSLAQGELIWIFDDDDVALPNAIADRVSALQSRPDAGFVYSPHYYGSDRADGRILKGRFYAIPEHSEDCFFLELMKGCFFSLGSALVRTDAYRTVGGFDTELLSSEDYDMLLRLLRVFPSVYCPEPSFIVRQHTGVRGAKAIRYSGNQRAKIFRRFDQRVGQKLRANLTMGDYLIPRKSQLEPTELRSALTGRLTVMASKGCLAEFFEDVHSLIDLVQSGEPLSVTERSAITSAMCTGYASAAIEDQWDEFKALLRQLPGNRAGRAVVSAIALGLFRLAKGYPAPLAVRWLRLRSAAHVALFCRS